MSPWEINQLKRFREEQGRRERRAEIPPPPPPPPSLPQPETHRGVITIEL